MIALLRQRGRVAYRTLKRQFQLEDEAVEDLKSELIESQRSPWMSRDRAGLDRPRADTPFSCGAAKIHSRIALAWSKYR